MHVTHPAPGVTGLVDSAEIPGMGFLPINAFVLHAAQPVLVDTGQPASRQQFLDALWSQLDPDDLRWIYLTHPDRDHTGSLMDVLEAAPSARVVTTFLGMGILSIEHAIPPQRVFLLNPGQSLDVGDRTLTAFRPPLYDSPATTGFVDDRTGACFSSDCFGAPMTESDLVVADDASAVAADELAAAQRLWATVDSPWVTGVDRVRFRASLEPLRRLDPSVVLATHLPPVHAGIGTLLDTIAGAPEAEPFTGPDQAALEALLAGFAPEQRSADPPLRTDAARAATPTG